MNKLSSVGLAIASFLTVVVSLDTSAKAGDIFQLGSQNTWNHVKGCAKDVGVGANGAVWVIGCNETPGGYGIYNWQGGSNWRGIPGGATRIAVGPKGNPVVVNNTGAIFWGDGNGNWQRLAGCARDVGVGANGALWVVGCNAVPGGYGVYQWTGSGWRGIAGGITAISVLPDGRPAAVNSHDEIFIGDGNGRWQLVGGRAKDIAVGADGSLAVIGNNVEAGGFGIYKRAGNAWQKIPGSAVRIAVAPNGVPWVVNNSNPSNPPPTTGNPKAEEFFRWANGQYKISRLDNLGWDSRGQCVTLVVRYLQEVFFNKSTAVRAYGHGRDVAGGVASKHPDLFEPLTNQGLPKRGAIISFTSTGKWEVYGHVGIVLESRSFNGQRQIKLMDSNKNGGAPNTHVHTTDWINMDQYAGSVVGWTNPR
ncbi:MAG: tectonin domain-containing protein [Synechococcales bacterium]|nr:tectonin domain-containing protein [Synechococcales bacterium]